MIVYQATKGQFLEDVMSNDIAEIILSNFKSSLNKTTQKSEIRSWENSMRYMDTVLRDNLIPDDCGVAIEYQIPQTSKRIDFILSGKNETNSDQVILIELKQWETAQLSGMDGLVITRFAKGSGPVSHPSYQVWTYATLLQGFNETVYEDGINLIPCAYLHNYISDDVIDNKFYKEYIDKAPIFFKSDARKLNDFIKKYLKYGDNSNILFRIDNGKIKPSKSLADSILSMIRGNKEFVMVDDQKVVYETCLALAKKSSSTNKNVVIVEGGPGTGKSVVAVNLLVALTNLGLLSQYVSKNAAPRAVFESRLTGQLRATHIRNLFRGSGAFIDADKNAFDALIVDEAHRLNEQSGLYGNLGKNQIKELIDASKFSIFFIDEDQKVTLKDIGEKKEIEKWAKQANANVYQLELASQFRCNGSDGYLAWLDNALQIRETANEQIKDLGYDFQVFSSPEELRKFIINKNGINNKARMVAGYCWNWISKNNPNLIDINLPEFDFKMRWNLTVDGSLWIINPNSVNEIGCIHTCQGLEVDYIGVVIGPDLIVRNGKVITIPSMRARSDQSIKGYKRLIKEKPMEGPEVLDRIIKNTYRTLMTRGMKGCFVYCTDKETELYFKNLLTS